MQLSQVFVSFLFAAAASAKGHGDKNSTSTKSECRQVAKLTALTSLAANDTKLAKHFDNNQTAIDAFKTKATDAEAKLKDLSSNSTLMGECAVIEAHSKAVRQCGQMAGAEKMVALAANDTALQAKFDGNTTKIDAFKTKAAEAQTKLTSLQSNTTVTTFCAVQNDIETCSSMKRLQKEVAMAQNQTALDTKFDGNTTKIDNFKTRATKAQAKLDTITANSTLMSTCSSLAKAQADQKSSSGSTTSQASTGTTSSAVSVRALGNVFTAAFVIVTCGALML